MVLTLMIKKIEKYKKEIDITKEVGNKALKDTKLIFTNDEEIIKKLIILLLLFQHQLTITIVQTCLL